MTCKRCGSHAINPHLHGREERNDLDLCDVCYWRKRAEAYASLHDDAVAGWNRTIDRVDELEAERDPAIRAAFAAGREAMRGECVQLAEDMRTTYIGAATACVTRHDTRTALDKADAFGGMAAAIRALPGKEG